MHKELSVVFPFPFFHNFINRYSSYITWQMTFQVMGCICFFLFLFFFSEGVGKKFGISAVIVVVVVAKDFICAFAFSFTFIFVRTLRLRINHSFSWFYSTVLPLAIFLRFFFSFPLRSVGFGKLLAVFVR